MNYFGFLEVLQAVARAGCSMRLGKVCKGFKDSKHVPLGLPCGIEVYGGVQACTCPVNIHDCSLHWLCNRPESQALQFFVDVVCSLQYNTIYSQILLTEMHKIIRRDGECH